MRDFREFNNFNKLINGLQRGYISGTICKIEPHDHYYINAISIDNNISLSGIIRMHSIIHPSTVSIGDRINCNAYIVHDKRGHLFLSGIQNLMTISQSNPVMLRMSEYLARHQKKAMMSLKRRKK